jgi:hypothetical protein
MVRIRWALHGWRSGMIKREDSGYSEGLFFGPVFCDAVSEAAARAITMMEKAGCRLDGIGMQVSFNCPIATADVQAALNEAVRCTADRLNHLGEN